MKEPVSKDSEAKIADRLTVIMGLNALLIDGAFGPLNDRQKNALREISQTSEELRELLEPVLRERHEHTPAPRTSAP
jgi:hypothetical protein